MHAVVKKTGATCLPNSTPVRWKDLRSGMACHLLNSGWSRDEVNARLGHTPSSKALDAYINYLAIDRKKPKQKLHNSTLEEIKNQLEQARKRERLMAERWRRQGEEMAELRQQVAQAVALVAELQRITAK